MSFRKISAAILAVIMCFSVHLGCAFADEGIEGETVAVIGDRAFSSLQDAFDALSGMPTRRGADADSENECIVLEKDSVQNSQMVLKNCSGTLDLNGYGIYNTVPIYDGQDNLSLISVQDYAKLNIIDSNSSGHNNGGIFALQDDCYATTPSSTHTAAGISASIRQTAPCTTTSSETSARSRGRAPGTEYTSLVLIWITWMQAASV